MSLESKKRMAAEILKVGVSRVRLDPESWDQFQDAITKDNIRALIKRGLIWAAPAKGVSRGRFRVRAARKRRRGEGSKKGAAGALLSRKSLWVTKVRALRGYLKKVKERGDITGEVFDRLYKQVKGGQVKSVRHLKELVKQAGRA